ncbi:hypothetical protein RB195_020197 [Necator americanus]|uniref:Phlebovirus glycoprotein G2 fusion domain-containing protein n=1 Tax=Necator americanus TaxID=51031 RepID=A0ABR1CHR2_NECAM
MMVSAALRLTIICFGIWIVSGIHEPPKTRNTSADILSCFCREPPCSSHITIRGKSIDCRELLSEYTYQDRRCLFSPIRCLFRYGSGM